MKKLILLFFALLNILKTFGIPIHALDYREIPDAMYYRWMSSLVKGDTIWNKDADSVINSVNPFASIGKNPKSYLTLSNGYYDENFTNDTLRQIGSVLINTVTNKVVSFSVQNEIQHPKDNSRFMSIDPIAKKYPELTPYQFSGNNPIKFIDLDGLEPAYNEINTPLGTVRRLASDQLQGAVPEDASYLNKNVQIEPNDPDDLLPTLQETADHMASVFKIATTGYDENGNKVSEDKKMDAQTEAIVSIALLFIAPEAEEADFGEGIHDSPEGTGPKANKGNAPNHGGPDHNTAIDNHIKELKKDPNVKGIRKNQTQVDANGNKVGNNRPDIQYDKNGQHHNVEYDHSAKNSAKHGKTIKKNDPNSHVELHTLPKKQQ